MQCSGGHQIRISPLISPNDVAFSSNIHVDIQHFRSGYSVTARTPENTHVPTDHSDGHNPSDSWQADAHVRSIVSEL